ncbi:sulfotransferase [Roseinatronobacter sp. S2]|uniref:sulfotransferase family protein n=1 Tax=Roseinatronobacter sp. S2 TaxID=3035471 RepID=UPI00240FC835|nr:sulfotransferase [Roseinatronobacter sp. S2]WFE74175.1 sulfotransferase [Roseinatronobacter sp. S2]
MNFIFITGHRKSGTTLLHKLFDGHPSLNVYPTDISLLYAYFPCFVPSIDNTESLDRIRLVLGKSLSKIDGNVVPGANNVFKLDSFLNFVINRMTPGALTSRSELLSVIASAWCEFNDLDTSLPFLLKETTQSIHWHDIKRADEKMKMIQIIRDPRDNFAAIAAGVKGYYSKMGEGPKETLASFINRARLDLLTASQLSHVNPDEFRAVKFEDLALELEKQMRDLVAFLGIDWCASLLSPTFLGEEFLGNSHEDKKMDGVYSGNVGRWRERIADEDAKVIEFWMRDAMHEWGYRLEFNEQEKLNAYSRFYDWYNCKYFYHDSFQANVN